MWERVKVSRIEGNGPVRRRIMDMGITKGRNIYTQGGTIREIPWSLRWGYELSVRRQMQNS